jgi:phenylacetate-CoA ligase
MPLIRYRLGDRGALLTDKPVCACGRTLPALAYVEGRMDDVVYTRDGRPVGRLDPVFKARVAIREAQVIQEAIDVIRVRYVAAEGFNGADARSIIRGLRARLGTVQVILEEVDAIPRTVGGKFRAVISNVEPSELQRVVG